VRIDVGRRLDWLVHHQALDLLAAQTGQHRRARDRRLPTGNAEVADRHVDKGSAGQFFERDI
jgi:hypothetical protein